MPRVWLAGLLLLGYGFVLQAEVLSELRLQISGLSQLQGSLYIAIYDSSDSWLGKETVQQSKVLISEALEGELVVASLSLPPGEYAFSIFYDENDNGELDTNFIGIPREPVALSNNARPRFGPPKYEDARFELGADPLLQQISMEDL